MPLLKIGPLNPARQWCDPHGSWAWVLVRVPLLLAAFRPAAGTFLVSATEKRGACIRITVR